MVAAGGAKSRPRAGLIVISSSTDEAQVAPNASETVTTVMPSTATTTTTEMPSTVATTTTTEMPATMLLGQLKQREMHLAETNPDGYSPGAQPTVSQLVRAAKELNRRIAAAAVREEAVESGAEEYRLGDPPPYQGELSHPRVPRPRGNLGGGYNNRETREALSAPPPYQGEFNHPLVPLPRGALDGENNEIGTAGDGLEAYPDVFNFPWVLVATECNNFPKNRMLEAQGAAGGKFKMLLENDGSLFLISVTEPDVHGTYVSELIRACGNFGFGLNLFFYHGNIVAQIPSGQTAPDCALKRKYPLSVGLGGPLRAPFIAEVHSGTDTIASSLNSLSLYLDQAVSDYVMYVNAYPKHTDLTYAAVAIIWRAGQGAAPLGPGVMAQFVSAHSFGSADLSPLSVDALGLNHGHLPGVPAAQLVRAPPAVITIPRAHLLGVVDRLGNVIPAAVWNNGPDLQINLPQIRDDLNDLDF